MYSYVFLVSCSGSHTHEPEKLTFPRMALPSNQDQLAVNAQMRQSHSQPPSLHDLDVTPEKEGILLLSYIRYCKCMTCTLITENIYLCV